MKEFKECIKCTYRPETCVDCEVMYRCEPAKEDEGQEKNRFESQEYRLVITVNFQKLLYSDIDPSVFKDLCLEDGFMSHHGAMSETIYDQSNFDYAIPELERLNFIEKVVHDPVVKINDCFKRNDGYKFMIVSAGSGRAILTGIDNNAVYKRNDIFCVGDKLSEFVGDTVKDFKPCKIKITEVEEG